MLATIALEPIHFAPAMRVRAPMAESVPVAVDAERQALIDEIRSVEGAPVETAPLLFRLVMVCGGAICLGAGGGLFLGVADLLGKVI